MSQATIEPGREPADQRSESHPPGSHLAGTHPAAGAAAERQPGATSQWVDDVPPNQDDRRYRLEGQAGKIRMAEARIAVCFIVPILAAVALGTLYVVGGQPQLEGILLFFCLAPLGVGLVLWARDLLPGLDIVDSRHVHEAVSTDSDRQGAERALSRGTDPILRRGFLVKILGLAGGLFGLAAIIPLGFLGSRPGKSLLHTTWTPGARLVDETGRPVKVGELQEGGIITVFPENHIEDPAAQTLLINIASADFKVEAGRAGWEQAGCVAFSKVCTHAGCPVGLYEVQTHQLVCPCHQSTFDVLEACKPVFGPASRPLPQLPLALDSEGYFIAQSDYTEPVGPGFWNRA